MKKIMILAGVLIAFSVNAQPNTASLKKITQDIEKNNIPEEVITTSGSYWTVSTISQKGDSDIFGNPYRDNNGKIVKFKFLENNRFELLTYTPDNENGNGSESWTQVTGTVVFSKDAKGQPIFTTMADKGIHRVIRNGGIATTIIPEAELKKGHSNTYLWEKAIFGEDPKKTYLLVLDLDEHPGADISRPESIHPSWVSKFSIRG